MERPPVLSVLPELRRERKRDMVMEQLGEPIQVYGAAKRPVYIRLLGPVYLVVGVLALWVGMKDPPVLFQLAWLTRVRMAMLCVGSGTSAVGLWMLGVSVLRGRCWVAVCPRGLLVSSWWLRVDAIAWETIGAVWKELRGGARAAGGTTYRIGCLNGVSYDLTDALSEVEQVGRVIECEVGHYLLPQAIGTYERGEYVVFDEIVVHQSGLHLMHKTQPLLWEDLEQVGINAQVISISRRGEYWEWATLPISRIANVAVLKALIAYARTTRQAPIVCPATNVQGAWLPPFVTGHWEVGQHRSSSLARLRHLARSYRVQCPTGREDWTR